MGWPTVTATKVPAHICRLVDARDDRRCVRCGVSLHSVAGSRHHRQSRRTGLHTPSNLVLLCGSGTTGCHGWVHGHPKVALEVGLMVPTYYRPNDVPVQHVQFGWTILADTGRHTVIPEETALAILRSFGLRKE